VLPISVAISAIGVYSLAIGLVYVRIFYGVAIEVHDWVAFLVSIPAAIGAIGCLGFLFASVLVRYRSAFMLGNVFEWPVWLISGLLIPVAVLPGWLQPVSWVFAPTRGMRALRHATLGTGSVWVDVAVCVALSLAYLIAGTLALRFFLRSARARATLALT
jgi:ABC-2 type transport system permease protein